MGRPKRETSQAILERRQASGLGTGCQEAQADGVPCKEIKDCADCPDAAKAVSAAKRPGAAGERQLTRSTATDN